MGTLCRWRRQVIVAAAGSLLALARFSPIPADVMSLSLDPLGSVTGSTQGFAGMSARPVATIR